MSALAAAEIVLKSHGDEVEVSGKASWGGVHTGELEGNGKPRDRVLAIGYDPDKSSFLPSQDDAVCAARPHLFGRYLADLTWSIHLIQFI
jgi:hypothetical protein